MNRINKPSLIGLLIILILAFWLRASDGAMRTHFRYDQAEMALMAMETWSGETFHWLGTPNSAGIPNSPWTIWIYIPVLIFSDSPQAITLFVGLLNVVGVGALWWIAHRYFSPMIGFTTGLVFAVSPWAINYSRAIWEPRTIMPLILIALAVGLYGYLEKKTWAQIAFAPLLLIALQFHYVALTLLPLYLIILWIGRQNIQWKWTILSIILGFLTFVPWIIGISLQDTERTAGNRFSMILDILEAGIIFRTYPLNQFYDLMSGQNAGIIPLPENWMVGWEWLTPMMAGFTFIGFIFVWLLPQWRKYALFVTVWSFITIIVLIPAWTGSGVYHHHFAANIPALMLLIGIGVGTILQWLKSHSAIPRGVWMGGLVAFSTVVVIGQGFADWRLRLVWDETYSTTPSGQTATPLHYLMSVRDALTDERDVLIFGANPHESNYYVWQPMLYNTAECVRDNLVDGSGVAVLPRSSFAAVLASPPEGVTMPEMYISDNVREIALRPEEPPYTIYYHDTRPEWTGSDLIAVDAPDYNNGVRLLGYTLQDTVMFLHWALPGESDDADFFYFGHFLNNNGDRIAQRDTAFYPPHGWCEGDEIITWVDIALPEETAILRVGLYNLREDGGTSNIGMVDGASWVDIPLNE